MHTTWPGDVHTLLLGAGSFVALMVVYAHHTLGAGLFVALMVVYAWPGDAYIVTWCWLYAHRICSFDGCVCTPHGRVMCIHCYLVLAHL